MRVAATTFGSMQYLCADSPPDHARRAEFAIVVPPLARTLLDSIFNLVLIFDDPRVNARWYFTAGWRDEIEHLQRLSEKHKGDPVWAEYIARYRRERLDHVERDAGVSAEEKKDPTKISRWPHPGGILRDQRKNGKARMSSQARRDFLAFVNDWHYGRLSGDSHLSPFGLVRRGWMLTEAHERDDKWKDLIALYKSQVFINAMMLYMALLSEVAAELGLTHEISRMKDLWRHIARWPEARELIDVRYGRLLSIDFLSDSG